MRGNIFIIWSILLFSACNSATPNFLQSNQVKLSPPQLSLESVFFEKNSRIKVLPSENETKVHYTTDGSTPNQNSPVYDQAINVTQSGIYHFIAMQDQFINSETVEVQLFATKDVEIKNAKVLKLSEKYPGRDGGLFDQKKGDFNFRSTAWKGFKGEATINIEFEKEQEIRGFVVSSLIDHKSWIFAPEEITITCTYADGKKLNHSNKFELVNSNDGKAKMEFLKIAIENSKPVRVSIHIKGPNVIPVWHPGVGKKPWLFLDEIVFL